MKAFLDSNILVYAFSRDDRAEAARRLLNEQPAVVGIQCLNEFVNVALRKLGMTWSEVLAALDAIEKLCELDAPIDLDLHKRGRAVAQRYRLGISDSLIIAAALRTGCDTLWSEDMQDGLMIDRLAIRNPFR